MLSAWLVLMLHTFFFPLRLSSASGSFPRALKPEEERDYLERFAAGDPSARDALIIHNLRLVAHIVKKYYTQGGDQDDLISIGTIGLIKGISTFKPDKNVRLATYASRCIENEILMHFRSQRKLQGEVSLSDSLDAEDENGSLSLMDILKVDDTMLDDLSAKDAGQAVRRGVENCLDEREKLVIRLRYGLNAEAPLTQREIAKKCGISRSYVLRRNYYKQNILFFCHFISHFVTICKYYVRPFIKLYVDNYHNSAYNIAKGGERYAQYSAHFGFAKSFCGDHQRGTGGQ